jgi:hypothetical protein
VPLRGPTAPLDCAKTGLRSRVRRMAAEALCRFSPDLPSETSDRHRFAGRGLVGAADRIAAVRSLISGGAAVLVDQAAEHVDPFHSRRRASRSNDGQHAAGGGWLQVEGAVWPGGVVMPQVLRQDPVQLPLIPDQRPVQTVAAYRAHPPFGAGRVARPGRRAVHRGHRRLQGLGHLARAQYTPQHRHITTNVDQALVS